VVGIATGKSSNFVLFGILIGQSDLSLKAAIEDAITNTKAHTLVNVFVDQSCWGFPAPWAAIWGGCEVRVTGTAIRYTNLKANSYFEAIGQTSSVKVIEQEKDLKEFDYKTMRALDKDNAIIYFKRLPPFEKERLKEYVIKAKGQASNNSWSFAVNRDLPADEREFVAWFCKEFTSYQPRVD